MDVGENINVEIQISEKGRRKRVEQSHWYLSKYESGCWGGPRREATQTVIYRYWPTSTRTPPAPSLWEED